MDGSGGGDRRPGQFHQPGGTPDQVADALLDYHELGVTTFLIRGFDPLEDAIDYGARLIPSFKAKLDQRSTVSAN